MNKKAARHRTDRLRARAMASPAQQDYDRIKREDDRMRLGPYHDHPLVKEQLMKTKEVLDRLLLRINASHKRRI